MTPRAEHKAIDQHYDRAADALYVYFLDLPFVRCESPAPGILVDRARDDRVIGVEFLSVSLGQGGIVYDAIPAGCTRACRRALIQSGIAQPMSHRKSA